MKFFSKLNRKSLTVFSFLFLLLTVIFLFSPHLTFAQEEVNDGLTPISENIKLTDTDIRVIVAQIIRIGLGLLGTVALVIMVYAGYLWMTSAGDEATIKKAKNMMINAAIGLAIILSSLAIVTFILNLLIQATGSLSDHSQGFSEDYGRGALGAGIIESHYPPRNAKNVPRNASIIVTFKAPMDLTSFATATDGNADGDALDFEDIWTLKTTSMGIYPKGADPTKTAMAGKVYTIKSEFTAESIKTIVVIPDNYFEGMKDYSVRLDAPITTADGTTPFVGLNAVYVWSFTTSNDLDFKPPYILGMEETPNYLDPATSQLAKPAEDMFKKDSDSKNGDDYLYVYNAKRLNSNIVPFVAPTTSSCNTVDPKAADKCQLWPRNVLIQVNFSEPVNPITVAGRNSYLQVYKYVGTKPADEFKINDQTKDDWEIVAGEWRLSSDYATAEFWADNKEGIKNSCDEEIALLPGNAIIRTYIAAATPKENDPKTSKYSPQITPGSWDGVTDVAQNAFDGNADTWATGTANDFPPVNPALDPTATTRYVDFDDFVWIFQTSDEIDISDPIIINALPSDGQDKIGKKTSTLIQDKYDFNNNGNKTESLTYDMATNPYYLEMSKMMSATSLKPNDSIYLWSKYQTYTDANYTTDKGVAVDLLQWQQCSPDGSNGCVLDGTLLTYMTTELLDYNGDNGKDHSGIWIGHEGLSIEKKKEADYNPVVSTKVKDLYQNCYIGGCCTKDNCVVGVTKNSMTGTEVVDKQTPNKDQQSAYDPNTTSPLDLGCYDYSANPLK